MEAGFGRVCITPPPGTRMFGWGTRDDAGGCDAVHDDLFARALWLRAGREDVLVMGFDLLFFSRDVADRLRGALGRRFDLAPRQILLNASHTHNGPTTGTWWTALYRPPDTLYLDALEAATLRAAEQALAARRDAILKVGKTCVGLAVSRRSIGADGRAQWIANRENTIYDEVPIALFEGRDHRPICLLFSISCHPSTVPGHTISADYPGAAMAALDEGLGRACSLFLQGVGGDTKVRSYRDEVAFGTTWDDVAGAGREAADAVIAAVRSGLHRMAPSLRAQEIEVLLPMGPIPSRDAFAGIRDDVKESEIRRLWAGRMAARLDRGEVLPTAFPITLHGLQLGDGVRLVGIEGEATARLGYLVSACCGDRLTFPLGYADGCQLYLPTDSMLPEGGYEVTSYDEYGFPAGLAPGIDGRVTKGIRALRAAGIR